MATHCRLLGRLPSTNPPFLAPWLWLPQRTTPTLPATISPFTRTYAATTRPPKIGPVEKPPKPPATRRIRRNNAPPLPPVGNKAIGRQLPLPPQPISRLVREESDLHPSIAEHIQAISLQPPYYATIHIHGKPYLVTVGDTITLPSLLYHPRAPPAPFFFTPTPGEQPKPFGSPTVLCRPGEMLRITHASAVGSRDYTIKGSPYIDGRLFTCRARVVEITSEPMRTKEKTKRRQRMTKTVKSKHRYTVLKICELEVQNPEGAAMRATPDVEETAGTIIEETRTNTVTKNVDGVDVAVQLERTVKEGEQPTV